MSINVTVRGNPISIKHGKMVTADTNGAKEEFKKRRRIRLEQVRQQSKDIAEDVRNRVRKEKSKQLSQLEKRGEKELKQWQARKLLALQQQYQECLKDIGLAHAQAALEQDSEDAEASRKTSNYEIAKERGQKAAHKLQIDSNKRNRESAIPLQHKKFSKAVEDTRAAIVSNLNKKVSKSPFKKKRRKRVSTDINISSSVISGSESDDVPRLLNLSSSNPSSSSPNTSDKENRTIQKLRSPRYQRSHSPTPITEESTQYTSKSHDSRKTKSSNSSVKPKPKSDLTHPSTSSKKQVSSDSDSEHFRQKSHRSKSPAEKKSSEKITKVTNYSIDTRISDRINSRTLLRNDLESQKCPNNCDCTLHKKIHKTYTFKPVSPKVNKVSETLKVNRDQNIPQPNRQYQEQNAKIQESNYHSSKTSVKKKEPNSIPDKPTISLRTHGSSGHTNSAQSASLKDVNKVQYYDHKNRFAKEYIMDKDQVTKIGQDNIDVFVNSESETEVVNKMYKRDHEAQVRGQKALEKVKLHRNYKEMMQQLPVLQKQERIASINLNKPKFHMSDDRLKELERKKQNRMENVYEQLFPDARMITISPKNHKKTDDSALPYKTIDVSESTPTLNVGTWDVNAVKSFSSNVLVSLNSEASELLQPASPRESDIENSVTQRKDNLRKMLRKLQSQRDKLSEEAATLPKTSNLYKILQDLGSLEENETAGKSINHKRSPSNKKLKSHTRHKATSTIRDKKSQSRTKNKTNSSFNDNKSKIQMQHSATSTSNLNNTTLDTSNISSDKEETKTNFCEKSEVASYLLQNEVDKKSKESHRKSSKYHTECTTHDTSSSSPTSFKSSKRKKIKKIDKQPVLMLQNTGTQTTPKSRTKTKQQPEQTHSPHEKSVPPPSPKKTTTCVNEVAAKQHDTSKLCKCKPQKVSDNLCEIVIKINDGGEPKICVSPSKIKNKEIIVKTTSESPKISKETQKIKSPINPKQEKTKTVKTQKVQQKNVILNVKDVKPSSADESKSAKGISSSWREYFGQNSSNGVSSSTSYFSPPDLKKIPQANSTLKENVSKGHSRHFANILSKKPQQTNVQNLSNISHISSSTSKIQKQMNPCLVQYISKLLTMSRASIDDLGASTVSDLSTPASSIVEVDTNNPLVNLKKFIKRYNLTLGDVEHYLNYSSDSSNNVHYNTAETLTVSSTDTSGSTLHKSAERCVTKYDSKGNSICVNGMPSSTLNVPQNETNTVNLTGTGDITTHENVLSQYNELAKTCNKRIENLSALIEKVRSEKLKMLHHPNSSGSEKENSTTYLDLPSHLQQNNLEKSSDSSSSHSGVDQDELTRSLLEIDLGLADDLKKLTAAQIKEKYSHLNSNVIKTINDIQNSSDNEQVCIDKELMNRFQKLVRCGTPDDKVFPTNATIAFTSQKQNLHSSQPKNENKEQTFVPFLLDIPRLPKLESSVVGGDNSQQSNGNSFKNDRSKPPPSKSRFNNNIILVPHELSTIVEADSQISTKVQKSAPSSKESTPRYKTHLQAVTEQSSNDPLTAIASDTAIRADKVSGKTLIHKDSISTKLPGDSKENMKKLNTGKPKSTKNFEICSASMYPAEHSDSSTSEVETMETVLKGLGMGWAVATLRKTQEALALTSSSSSLDISITQKEIKLTDSSSSSEISLKKVLGREMIKKLSSSTSNSDILNMSQLMREFQNISAIEGSAGTSHEKTNQRTSTPVQLTELQGNVFLADSETSTVNIPSDDNLDMQFCTLNASESTLDKNSIHD